MQFNYCGSVIACSYYFMNYRYSVPYTILYNWNFTLNPGYNKISLAKPVLVPKGSVLLLTQYNGSVQIVIDDSGSAPLSDIIWNKNIINLNSSSNWRFFINTISNFSLLEGNMNFSHRYFKPGLYNLTVTVLSSNLKNPLLIEITDCNLLN